MARAAFQNLDRVKIRKGTAKGTSDKRVFSRASGAFTGDVAGCRGVVVGSEVKKDGTEIAAVCVTDTARDGKPTGILEVPVENLSHVGVRGVVQDAARSVRRLFSGAGKSRVLHGNAVIDETPQKVEPSPYARLVGSET